MLGSSQVPFVIEPKPVGMSVLLHSWIYVSVCALR
jgi:hypothetical protein